MASAGVWLLSSIKAEDNAAATPSHTPSIQQHTTHLLPLVDAHESAKQQPIETLLETPALTEPKGPQETLPMTETTPPKLSEEDVAVLALSQDIEAPAP